DRAEVAERELVDQFPGVVGVERAPAAVLALHALEPAQAAPDRRAVLRGALLEVEPAQGEDDLGGVVGVGVVVVLELERPAARGGARAADLPVALLPDLLAEDPVRGPGERLVVRLEAGVLQ